MSEKLAYIYEITNDFDDTVYVGQTENPEGRWNDHLSEATNPLYVAMARAGAERFKFTVVSEVKWEDGLSAEGARIVKHLHDGRPIYNRKVSQSALFYGRPDKQPRVNVNLSSDTGYPTVKQFARKWNVGTVTVRSWIKEGMPHVNLGSDLRIIPDEADKWVKAGGPARAKKRSTRTRRQI